MPGRTFTRRLYAHSSTVALPHHHIQITQEIRLDLECWQAFLEMDRVFSRPFFHFQEYQTLSINFATDASRNPNLGAGGNCGGRWFIMQWNKRFIRRSNPSINYLELYALTVGILLSAHLFKNEKISIACDNMSVVHMVNKSTSKCKNCMVLIRIIVLHSLVHNVKIKVRHISSELNRFPDMLSRLQYKQFKREVRKSNLHFRHKPDQIPEEFIPMDKLWLH